MTVMSRRRRGMPRVNQANDEGVDPNANLWAQMMQQQQAMQQQNQQMMQLVQQQIHQQAQSQQQWVEATQ